MQAVEQEHEQLLRVVLAVAREHRVVLGHAALEVFRRQHVAVGPVVDTVERTTRQ